MIINPKYELSKKHKIYKFNNQIVAKRFGTKLVILDSYKNIKGRILNFFAHTTIKSISYTHKFSK